jgi:hypothetical protein
VRSVQLRSYDSTTLAASVLRPRRLLVWEGRRKGCAGVGWGTGALIGDGVGAEIRERARRRAEKDAATAASSLTAIKKKLETPAASTAKASGGGGGKEADPEDDVRGEHAACVCVSVYVLLDAISSREAAGYVRDRRGRGGVGCCRRWRAVALTLCVRRAAGWWQARGGCSCSCGGVARPCRREQRRAGREGG